MLGNNEEGIAKLRQLNGHLIIIAGNHDTDNRIELYKKSWLPALYLGFAYRLKHGKWTFMLSHYPTIVDNPGDEHKKIWNLHGHTHSKWKYTGGKCYNVNMDAHDCYPVNIETIIKDLKNIRDKGELLCD